MDGHLAGGKSAVQLMNLAEHGPPQDAATGGHLVDGALVTQIIPLERDLPQKRASPLMAAASLDGQSVYE
jgi:hypothetical protein